MAQCQVYGCRFKDFHTTIRHCCGTCKHNGHGQYECKEKELFDGLKLYYDDKITSPCILAECQDNETHTTEGHSCLYCNKRDINNHLPNCPNNKNTTFKNSICDDKELFNSSLKLHINDINVKYNINEYNQMKQIYKDFLITMFVIE